MAEKNAMLVLLDLAYNFCGLCFFCHPPEADLAPEGEEKSGVREKIYYKITTQPLSRYLTLLF